MYVFINERVFFLISKIRFIFTLKKKWVCNVYIDIFGIDLAVYRDRKYIYYKRSQPHWTGFNFDVINTLYSVTLNILIYFF